MCTIMLYPETLPAEKLSITDSQKSVDQLMEYDCRLQKPFTKEELQKLFSKEEGFFRSLIRENRNYEVLTESEKQILDELGLSPERIDIDSSASHSASLPVNVSDQRRQMKAQFVKTPVFAEYRNIHFGAFCYGLGTPTYYGTGKIYVWLDNMCFGNSDKTGFYYVRWINSLLDGATTCYGHPVLIVQKNKLRPDQIEYMEHKCKETEAERNREYDHHLPPLSEIV